MNALEAASLVMIPSGYEDGTLGSLKPIDGSGDFTFSRGSNLSATRVKEDGYIEKGYENLLTYSNDYSNAAWTKSNLLPPANGYEGYDGSYNAWKLVPDSSSSSHIRQSLSTTGIITTTIYAKAAEWNYVGIYVFGSNKGVVWSLIDGSVQNPIISYPEIYSNGESIGNGWWKFSMTHNVVSGDVRIWPCEQNIFNGNTPDGVSGIYIQDAQLNQGLVALPYVESGATNGLGGLLENDPRIDFTGGGCGSLLLEPSRTNVIPFSEYFDGFWNSLNLTELYNNAVSPEGLQNAVKVYPTTTGSFRGISKNFGVSLASVPYTFSVFAKAGELEQLFFYNVGAPAGNGGVWFNLSSGIVGTTTVSWSNAQMEDYGNGWYRCSAVITPAASGQNIYALLSDANNLVSVTSNGTDGLYLYGTQLEQGYKTSYIPTNGVSQTRAEDVCTDAGDVNTFNSTEGVLFFEGSILDLSGNNKAINISASNLNVHSLNLKWRAGLEQMQVIGVANSGVNVISTFSISSEIQLSNSKYAMVWNSTELKVYINGILKTTSSISTPFVTNSFTECNMLSGAEILYGNVNQLLVFPTALSDSECIALTTI